MRRNDRAIKHCLCLHVGVAHAYGLVGCQQLTYDLKKETNATVTYTAGNPFTLAGVNEYFDDNATLTSW
jgi:hypothetical protein